MCQLKVVVQNSYLLIQESRKDQSWGPFLYTIFTNELPNILDNNVDSNICCYADDTTVSCTAKTETDLTVALTKQFKIHDRQ